MGPTTLLLDSGSVTLPDSSTRSRRIGPSQSAARYRARLTLWLKACLPRQVSGPAGRHPLPPGFLMRPQLDSRTLAGPKGVRRDNRISRTETDVGG